eukprot:2119250-Pyramimonas_sp.AAC.1
MSSIAAISRLSPCISSPTSAASPKFSPRRRSDARMAHKLHRGSAWQRSSLALVPSSTRMRFGVSVGTTYHNVAAHAIRSRRSAFGVLCASAASSKDTAE